jgi:hypothetical protein
MYKIGVLVSTNRTYKKVNKIIEIKREMLYNIYMLVVFYSKIMNENIINKIN